MIFLLLKSPFLEKRIKAVNEFKEIIENIDDQKYEE